MNSNRMNEVVARVVAWHNRHPLARRITPAQVDGIGVIALPFVTTAERAGGALRADLIAPRVVVEPSFEPPTLDQAVTIDPPSPAGEGVAPAPGEAAKTSLRERAMAQAEAGLAPPRPGAGPGAPATAEVPAKGFGRVLQALRRLLWPGSRAGFTPTFSEDFIAPLSTRRVARWALQHGNTTRPGEAQWPQREVLADPALQGQAMSVPGVEPVTLYLVTAAIDTPTRRLRVLLGRGGSVAGPRELSPARMVVAGLLLVAGLALAAWVYWRLQQPPSTEAAVEAPSPASEAASGAASVPAPILTQSVAPPLPASEAASMPAHGVVVPAPAPASAPAPAAPAHVASLPEPPPAAASRVPQGGKSLIPDIDKQAALRESQQLRASAPQPMAPRASAPQAPEPRALAPAPVAPAAAPPKPAETPAITPGGKPGPAGASAPAGVRFYALVTKPSFSKVESEARMVLLKGAAANAIAPLGTRIELIQARQAWQAVWWPFPKRDDAERARQLLAARGVLVELVEF